MNNILHEKKILFKEKYIAVFHNNESELLQNVYYRILGMMNIDVKPHAIEATKEQYLNFFELINCILNDKTDQTLTSRVNAIMKKKSIAPKHVYGVNPWRQN